MCTFCNNDWRSFRALCHVQESESYHAHGCRKDRALLKLIELNLHHSSDISQDSEHYYSVPSRYTSDLLIYQWQTNLLEE
uniref:Uncharacterized protein n=1 Tax=Setaria italica TaxID=4555 RepID=K4AHG7_SETIT